MTAILIPVPLINGARSSVVGVFSATVMVAGLAVGVAMFIEMVTTRLAVLVALAAYTVTVVDPAMVGVPEITPVLVSSDSPAGKAVELKLVGALVAVMV